MGRVLNNSTRLYLEVILAAVPPDCLPNPLESGGFSHKGYGDLSDVVGLGSLTPSLSPLRNGLGPSAQSVSPRVGVLVGWFPLSVLRGSRRQDGELICAAA